MKPYQTLIITACLVVAGISFDLKAESVAPPDVLLDLSISHGPSNSTIYTFTPTGNAPLVSTTNFSFGDGFDLSNFYSDDRGASNQSPEFPSTLSTSIDKTPFYDVLVTDDYTQPGSFTDLSVYSDVSDANSLTETFSTSSPAFIGSLQITLNSAVETVVPQVGYIGDIFAGYSGDLEGDSPDSVFSLAQELDDMLPLLGQYEVIPEPSQWSLLLLGVGGLLAARRFLGRKQA